MKPSLSTLVEEVIHVEVKAQATEVNDDNEHLPSEKSSARNVLPLNEIWNLEEIQLAILTAICSRLSIMTKDYTINNQSLW